MGNPETDLKASIIEAVNALGICLVWSTPAGGVKARGGFIRLAPPGTPDILGYMFPDGRLVGLEVKTKTGTTQKARKEKQREWRERAGKCGAVVGEVRSVEEAIAVVREALAERRAA